jgi:hypothetical protein
MRANYHIAPNRDNDIQIGFPNRNFFSAHDPSMPQFPLHQVTGFREDRFGGSSNVEFIR